MRLFKKKDRLVIKGGRPLEGRIPVSGAKNAALPILAATLLCQGESEIHHVPYMKDVVLIIKMLNALGLRAEFHQGNVVKISNIKKVRHIAPYELVTAMRASFFVAGPLLAMTGFAKVPLPGGCSIGSRPIDLHLKGFEKLGAEINIEHGFVELKAKQLRGAHYSLRFPSVGATENIMMAATLADGETVIDNVAQEPEIVDLAAMLNKAGAKISGAGSKCITIQGVRSLHGVQHRIISDRIEAGTLLVAGAISKGDVTVEGINPQDLEALARKLSECGLKVVTTKDSIRVARNGHLSGVKIETLPFPGFPTDIQAQMMSLLTISKGSSVIKEAIFENRFMHAHELMRMGAQISLDNQYAFISGVEKLTSAEVKMTDLRAGAALILAGIAAEGETIVYGIKHLKRGYENLPEKLNLLGAQIEH